MCSLVHWCLWIRRLPTCWLSRTSPRWWWRRRVKCLTARPSILMLCTQSKRNCSTFSSWGKRKRATTLSTSSMRTSLSKTKSKLKKKCSPWKSPKSANGTQRKCCCPSLARTKRACCTRLSSWMWTASFSRRRCWTKVDLTLLTSWWTSTREATQASTHSNTMTQS